MSFGDLKIGPLGFDLSPDLNPGTAGLIRMTKVGMGLDEDTICKPFCKPTE